MATFTTDQSGRIIATAGPKIYTPPTQSIKGSAIDAASSKTLADQTTSAAASRTLGVGQKGARRTRKRRRGGAANLNAQIPSLPEAGTIKGVSHETNHLNAVNTLNQLKADSVYDSQINAPAMQVAGRKRKTRRKSNGGRHHRTHRRKHRKHTRRCRGSRCRI